MFTWYPFKADDLRFFLFFAHNDNADWVIMVAETTGATSRDYVRRRFDTAKPRWLTGVGARRRAG